VAAANFLCSEAHMLDWMIKNTIVTNITKQLAVSIRPEINWHFFSTPGDTKQVSFYSD
jgi:hypothetical protein